MHTIEKIGNRKISTELIDDVCDLIASGSPRHVAARACGILEIDYLLWMKEGSKPQHINECHGCDFAEFSFRLLRAEAKLLAEVSLGIYRAALSGDIRASSLILDRFEWEDLVEEERVQLSREQIGTSMRELEQLISQVKSTRKITQNSGY